MLARTLVGEVSLTVLMNLDLNASMSSNGVLGPGVPRAFSKPMATAVLTGPCLSLS